MKKLNTTYLDNLVSKILKETLDDRANNIVSKLTESGNVCECGGTMYEGECNECGYKGGDMEEGIYDVKDLNNSEEFDYVQEDMVLGDSDNEELDSKNEDACKYHMKNFGPEDERTHKFCGSDMNESLKGRQRRLDRNKNNKIDAEDFKMLRKGETKEGKTFPDLTGDGKVTRKDVLVGRGVKLNKSKFEKNVKGLKNNTEKHGMEENKKSYRVTENELVSMIEKIVKEQKTETVEKTTETKLKPIGGTPKGYSAYEKAHKGSGKENDDNIKAVTKKMKEYLKDGSKGDYSMEPKVFPKGNGELEKMNKKAYIPSKAVEEFTDNLTAAGLENLDYDEIHPNEEWVDDLVVGSSRTGNNPDWANTGETDINQKRNKIRKDNMLAKIKRKAYNKSPQPIVSDKSGEDSSDKLMVKLESIDDKKTKQINEEFGRMKSLIGYDRKTQ
jgi:hypothetical protein